MSSNFYLLNKFGDTVKGNTSLLVLVVLLGWVSYHWKTFRNPNSQPKIAFRVGGINLNSKKYNAFLKIVFKNINWEIETHCVNLGNQCIDCIRAVVKISRYIDEQGSMSWESAMLLEKYILPKIMVSLLPWNILNIGMDISRSDNLTEFNIKAQRIPSQQSEPCKLGYNISRKTKSWNVNKRDLMKIILRRNLNSHYTT